jgi:hypothetical protein
VTGFVRASRLYDLAAGESLRFDWEKMQPLDESQAEVEQAVTEIETDGGRCER